MSKIMKSLNSISRCQSTYRNEKLKVDGICACHHAFILNISKNPGQSQEEITRKLCLNKSTITRTLTHLENCGYITRTPNPDDKRQILVYPTDKMRSILPEVRAIAKEWNDKLVEDISEDELEIFHSVLHRLESKAKSIVREL
ncbi:MAG: MarR family transcriptional regulator [Clostridia bacterium]|nr:MarR family transcriptional regulator [Clostridia bacterium]